MGNTTVAELRERHIARVSAAVKGQLRPIKCLTGVFGSFTATHVGWEDEPHQHTWEVEAWFELPAPADARLHRASLDMVLALWDGKALPENIQSNEEIATAVATLVNCVEVTVKRAADRLGARVLR